MGRRELNKALHWTNALLVFVLMFAPSPGPAFHIAFSVVGLGWSGLALVRGLSGRPGPKLQGFARHAHIWGHRVLYLVTASAAFSAMGVTLGINLPFRQLLIATFGASLFHSMFHLWRHTTLYDNALHMILPKIMHKWL